jgi:hypothetical protein
MHFECARLAAAPDCSALPVAVGAGVLPLLCSKRPWLLLPLLLLAPKTRLVLDANGADEVINLRVGSRE